MRNRIHQLSVCLLVAATGVWAQPGLQQSMSHEGINWTRTTSGNFPCALQGRARLSVAGDLVVRGQARNDCYFRIKQRVAASSSERAQQLMHDFRVQASTQNDQSVFSVMPATSGFSSLLVEVAVPKGMREVVSQTQIGAVKAYDLDGAAALESGGGNIEMDRIGGAASCRTEGGNITVGRVNSTLRCYSGGGQIRIQSAGGETWCDTAGGEILVSEVKGPLHATNQGGNIEVERADGLVRAFSLLGLIDIQSAGGLVTAETRGGSIQVGSSRGAKCEAGKGPIRVRSSDGPMRLSTLSGNILAELVAGRTFQESVLSTMAGDITLLIPSNLAVTVEARNETQRARGRIISDFSEIQTQPFQPGVEPRIATGELNGGGPVVRLVAAGGNIYLKRQR